MDIATKTDEIVRLSLAECDDIAGGMNFRFLGVVGQAAMVYKTAYDTATWFGADDLGSYLGSSLYDFTSSF